MSILTLKPQTAPTIIPHPCDTSVTNMKIVKKIQMRNVSNGCAVNKYVINTYINIQKNCNGKSANVNAK